jgi:hypothetical protein
MFGVDDVRKMFGAPKGVTDLVEIVFPPVHHAYVRSHGHEERELLKAVEDGWVAYHALGDPSRDAPVEECLRTAFLGGFDAARREAVRFLKP